MTKAEMYKLSNLVSRLREHEFEIFAGLVATVFFLIIISWLLNLISGVQRDNAIQVAPYISTTALITSKDSSEKLSVKSPDLPKKGDVIDVDQYTYGAVSPGDRVWDNSPIFEGDRLMQTLLRERPSDMAEMIRNFGIS
jgi:hypothetical protein